MVMVGNRLCEATTLLRTNLGESMRPTFLIVLEEKSFFLAEYRTTSYRRDWAFQKPGVGVGKILNGCLETRQIKQVIFILCQPRVDRVASQRDVTGFVVAALERGVRGQKSFIRSEDRHAIATRNAVGAFSSSP